jgi:hypothetical protein
MPISIDNSNKGAGVLKHDSILLSHQQELIDFLGKIDRRENWVTLDIDSFENGIFKFLFEVV